MRTAQPGDHIQVHYVKSLQNGSVTSSRGRAPLQLTVGIDHPRLPGIGVALVGLAPGTHGEEELVLDDRGGLSPSQMVELKLAGLLKTLGVGVSQVIGAATARQSCPHLRSPRDAKGILHFPSAMGIAPRAFEPQSAKGGKG